MSDKIILSDHNIQYPPQSELPPVQGSFILLRLSQFPAKDKETKAIIDGEYTNCCFTSAFGRQTQLALPNGQSLTLTVSKWRRNQEGTISNPSSGDGLTYWFEDSDQDKLKYCIENHILYVYGDTNNPDDLPMLPEAYKKRIGKLNSQTMVTPINKDVGDQINQELGDG